MPNTDNLFKRLLNAYQTAIPKFIKDIDTGHPSANTKDRLREVYDVINLVLRYIIAENAERHGVDLGRIPATVIQENINPAQLAVQHFPASAPLSLSSPTNFVGSMPPQTVVAGMPVAEEPEPEPDNVMQVIKKRNGQTVVIPPRNSRAQRRVFEPGQSVDTMYIVEADSVPTESSV
jgi:hypothetical protein